MSGATRAEERAHELQGSGRFSIGGHRQRFVMKENQLPNLVSPAGWSGFCPTPMQLPATSGQGVLQDFKSGMAELCEVGRIPYLTHSHYVKSVRRSQETSSARAHLAAKPGLSAAFTMRYADNYLGPALSDFSRLVRTTLPFDLCAPGPAPLSPIHCGSCHADRHDPERVLSKAVGNHAG